MFIPGKKSLKPKKKSRLHSINQLVLLPHSKNKARRHSSKTWSRATSACSLSAGLTKILSQELMHPKKHISRTYEVTTVTPKDFTENILKSKLGRLAKGVRIKGHQTLSCVIELVRFEEIRHRAIIRITLHEGKNRQIRRMLGSINLQVLMLVRISIGGLTLDDLKLEPGKYLQLRDEHIKLLFH